MTLSLTPSKTKLLDRVESTTVYTILDLPHPFVIRPSPCHSWYMTCMRLSPHPPYDMCGIFDFPWQWRVSSERHWQSESVVGITELGHSMWNEMMAHALSPRIWHLITGKWRYDYKTSIRHTIANHLKRPQTTANHHHSGTRIWDDR